MVAFSVINVVAHNLGTHGATAARRGAGITTCNALRNADARAGDLVAVQGLGGLGRLAVQFASPFGFRAVATSCDEVVGPQRRAAPRCSGPP